MLLSQTLTSQATIIQAAISQADIGKAAIGQATLSQAVISSYQSLVLYSRFQKFGGNQTATGTNTYRPQPYQFAGRGQAGSPSRIDYEPRAMSMSLEP